MTRAIGFEWLPLQVRRRVVNRDGIGHFKVTKPNYVILWNWKEIFFFLWVNQGVEKNFPPILAKGMVTWLNIKQSICKNFEFPGSKFDWAFTSQSNQVGLLVLWLLHCFAPNRNMSTGMTWTAIKFCMPIHDAHWIEPEVFHQYDRCL